MTAGIDLLGTLVLQIAREDHHVGILRIDGFDNLLQHGLPVADVGAYMGIAEVHDAVAVEGCRHCRPGIAHLDHLELT